MTVIDLIEAAKDLSLNDRKLLVREVIASTDATDPNDWDAVAFLNDRDRPRNAFLWTAAELKATEESIRRKDTSIPIQEAIAALKAGNL